MKSLIVPLVFVAATASAQVRESVTVEVIEVPVHVTAPDGQPVRGLSRDAFELRVNGRVAPIEYFDAVDLPAPAADAAPTAAEPVRVPARERRLYLLLFDTAFAHPGKLPRAQKAAEMAVARANLATDLFAVATLTPSRGLQFVTPFLSDRAATLRAIRTLTISRTADPFGLAMSVSDRTAWVAQTDEGNKDYVEMGRSGPRGGGGGGEAGETMAGEAALVLAEKGHRVEAHHDNLATLANRLRGLEGQKHVLYFSSGLPVSQFLFRGSNSPVPGSATDFTTGLDARALRVFNEMARVFADAGVAVDTIDIDGLPVDAKPGDDPGDSLRMLSRATGGEYVHNRNDFGEALTEVTAAQRVVYILGFNRRNRRGATISVHVKGAPVGSSLSYRTSFGAAGSRKDVDPLQLLDVLVNDVPQNDITARLTVSNSTAMLELRPAELPEESKSIYALLYVFNTEGLAVAGYEKRIPFDSRLRAQKTPIVIRKPLDLPPGRYVAKVVVQAGGTASLGFARTELTVE